jgi:tRNA (guanine-N7-)-methyltransferase
MCASYEGDAIEILRNYVCRPQHQWISTYFSQIHGQSSKHNKRRIVNAEFLALIHRKLKSGGYINIATDWVPYAESISDVFSGHLFNFIGGEVARVPNGAHIQSLRVKD